MRAMHMLNIASIALADNRESRPNRIVLDCLMRHDGCATAPIIQGRSHLDDDTLESALDSLSREGIVAAIEDDLAGTMYQITEEGKTTAAEWRRERDQANAAFLDALSEEEKSQLADLIQKMLQSSAHKDKMNAPS